LRAWEGSDEAREGKRFRRVQKCVVKVREGAGRAKEGVRMRSTDLAISEKGSQEIGEYVRFWIPARGNEK